MSDSRSAATTRPFRFGAQLPRAASAEEWVATARELEDLGYSTLFMPDHFDDQLAPVPALMAAADATTTLRVGSLVLDNDYEQSGIPYDRPGVRIDRFVEGLAIIKGLLSDDGPVTFAGEPLHGHRARGHAQAGAEAASADSHRRRRQAGAVDRGA